VIDVVHEINAAGRTVGSRTLEPGEARTVTVRRVYESPLEDVWDACTNAERIPRWFLPISGELREGGRFQLEGNAGGTIQRCDPPQAFDATWEYGGEVSWIELRLTAEGDERTRFELVHIARVGDERWTEFGPGAVGVGWELGLLGLALHLRSGAAVDPKAFEGWSTSEAGKAFMSGSAERWGEASAAAGDDAEAARAAAARTAAFYTGADAAA
jgi:uncharacterized protein YndB with AHSA1/START domain